MTRWAAAAAAAAVLAGSASGCTAVVDGSPTWVGARVERALLGAGDVGDGAGYERIADDPGRPDGVGGASPMLTRPPGCSDGLTKDIAAGAQRGPGAAAQYTVTYPGARIVMTVTSWPLDLARLSDTATRCARFEALFDPTSPGIPVSTIALPSTAPDQLRYEQRLSMGGAGESLWMAFGNAGGLGVFGVATPTGAAGGSPQDPASVELPAAFLDLVDRQTDRMASA